MDQNEKNSQEYGCTHVALIDESFQMICGYASMEVKIPILTYKYASRSAVLKCRVWNLSRIDQGQEFFIMLICPRSS